MNWIMNIFPLLMAIALVLIYVDFFIRLQSEGHWAHLIAMTLIAAATVGAWIQLYLKAKREEKIGLREPLPLTIAVAGALGALFAYA